ncbi:DUF2591 family protein [Aeromonas salmonicida]|uniref:phage protein NinX family protein n=1 Tax=Aeromonas salmonicida TaxID=645 RepID=UPI00223EFC19|nr:phage protein NinX family protein [Aeromonas salmonicida]MDF8330560.1 DUF2591 family protein [Aeromonas salmonicida]
MIESVEVRINDLSGRALDWAVAEADGLMPYPFKGEFWVLDGKTNAPLPKFSTDWAQGGPLIDEYQLTISSPKSPVHRNGGPLNGWNESGSWTACTWEKGVTGKRAVAWDIERPLVAACRAIVSAKFGGFVKVPAVLVGGAV